MWASSDGRTWRSLTEDPTLGGTTLTTAVIRDNVIIAGGLTYLPDRPPDADKVAAFAHSEDGGATWSAAPKSPDFELAADVIDGWDVGVRAMVTFGGDLVAVGSDSRGGVVWRSGDGIAWTRVASLEGGAAEDVVAGSFGLVAVGTTGGPESRARVWRSVDGVEWTPVLPHPDGPGLSGIATWGTKLVAVGGDPSVWISENGRAWRRIASRRAMGDGWPSDLAVGPRLLVAVGTSLCDRDPRPGHGCPTAWASENGQDWSAAELTADESAFVEAVAVGDSGRVVAAGHRWPGDGDPQALSWVTR